MHIACIHPNRLSVNPQRLFPAGFIQQKNGAARRVLCFPQAGAEGPDLPAEFTGGNAGCLAEYPQEIGVVPETAFDGDFLQGDIRVDHLAGEFNPAVQDIIVDAPAGNPGEFMAEIADADAKAPGQVISLDGLVVIRVNIGGDFPDQGFRTVHAYASSPAC